MAQTITIDSTPGVKPPILYYSQGDIGRSFAISVVSRDGFHIPSGATVKMQATKPSGFGFSVSGVVSEDTVTFTTTETMTDETGRFPAELQITHNDDVIGTANFFLEGEQNPHPSGTTDGMADQMIPILTVLVERIETAANSIHNLTVESATLEQGASATVAYDSATNKISFGIPRGSDISTTDDGSGNIVMTFI